MAAISDFTRTSCIKSLRNIRLIAIEGHGYAGALAPTHVLAHHGRLRLARLPLSCSEHITCAGNFLPGFR